MLLNNQWVTEEIKKIPGDKWKWKCSNPKSVGCSKRKVHGNTAYFGKWEKSQINNLTLLLKE